MIHTDIKTTHMDLTPALSEYLEKKITMLEKYIDPDDTSVSADVEIEKLRGQKTGDVFRAEINFFRGGKKFRAESKKDDIYAAIDEIKDDIARRIRKDKNKRFSLMKRGGKRIKHMMRGFRR